MKFHYSWLKKLINLKHGSKEIVAQITGAGLEVESLNEDIFDLKIPPNRADCLGMVGIAREVAAINGLTFSEPTIKPASEKNNDKINLQVQDSAACPKYLGRIIKDIDNTRQTPQWIKDCLTTAEMKLISPVVDITNYVLLEWGQPLHAFDLYKLQGDIVIRKAHTGETLTLLDESAVELTPQTLIIADSKKPLAIAGVKGGMESGINLDTKDILLECAYFEPIGVRLTSKYFNLKTDGAYRFERGIDPHMQEKVMEHVTQMILDVVGGTAGPVIAFVDQAQLPKTTVVSLRLSRIKTILGLSIDAQTATQILQRLGCQVETRNHDDELMVTVPSFRQDITREVDLIEEVGRIYGFHNIPALPTMSILEFNPLPAATVSEQQVLTCLANRGYQEAITYSFIEAEYAKLFSLTFNEELCLSNPISSEMNYMRASLLPGLIKTLVYNQNRQQERIRLFEIGLRFTGTLKNVQQSKTIAGVCYGQYLPEGWGNQKRAVDIFDVKSDVLALLQLAHNNENVLFQASTDVAMHSGQCMDIILVDKVIGKIGTMHPRLQQTLGLPNPAIMFEIDYHDLVNGKIAQFNPFSKYPTVRRDIAILVDQSITAGVLENAIRDEIGMLLTDLVLFDVYQGKGVPDGQKSMALGLMLQHPDRTLTDTETNDVFANVVSMLQREFKATLRV